jgi:hypothetical protein
LSTLRQLIAAEIAKRDNAEDMKPALHFVTYDKHPAAMTDAKAAVEAIIAEADSEHCRKIIYVTRAIQDEVMQMLERRFPKRLVICQPIVAPGQSLRETARPQTDLDLDPVRIADAADRAAERIARLRDAAG